MVLAGTFHEKKTGKKWGIKKSKSNRSKRKLWFQKYHRRSFSRICFCVPGKAIFIECTKAGRSYKRFYSPAKQRSLLYYPRYSFFKWCFVFQCLHAWS